MATAMAAALLKPSSFSSSSYCRNQSINGRSIINPPPPATPTRISFPFNQRLFFTPLTQTPHPKITTTTTTKCSNSSSSSSKGSTFREEKEKEKEKEKQEKEEVPYEILKEALWKVVKGLEKPALTAVLVWVLLTNNPIIAASYSSRTAVCWGVWFVYDVCKAIASIRRIDDDGSIRFSLGNVLGSAVILSSGLMALLLTVLLVVLIAVSIGILLFICGSAAVIFLLAGMFIGMVIGFGEVTWPALLKKKIEEEC